MGDGEGLPRRSGAGTRGVTLPLLPSTLPKRTEKIGLRRARVVLHDHLAHALRVAPMTLVGFTALSVEMKMKRAAP